MEENNEEHVLPVKALFLPSFGGGSDSFLSSLPLERKPDGSIVTDDQMKTNIPGVFAIGDCRNTTLKQVVTACSDGAIASLSIIGRRMSRFLRLICLESLRSGCVKSSGRITAAAYTGPARQPLPASSQPASTVFSLKCFASMFFTFRKIFRENTYFRIYFICFSSI